MSTLEDEEPRPYGFEDKNDVFSRACTGSVCRLARFNPNGFGCPNLGQGSCKLECSPERADQVKGAYWDARRSILNSMGPQNACTVTVTSQFINGLPYVEPITVGLHPLTTPVRLDTMPHYVVVAEGLVVDGPFDLTLLSLKTRLDQRAKPRPTPKKPGSSAGDPSGRR